MEDQKSVPATVDEYIAQFPEDVRQVLNQMRATVKENAPQAEERISYGMPGYFMKGRLVWFGGFKKHVSFFPTTSGIEHFQEELAGYKQSKGTVQFPLDKPIPYDLIAKIVKFRVEENLRK